MISYLLPIRNELHSIEGTIESILKQNYNGQEYEILVADGMSDDGTREIIQQLSNNNNKIYLIDNPEQIVPTGFNKILSMAKGEIIVRVDGHSQIDKNFIDACITEIERTNADCVGSKTDHIATGVIGNSINLAQSSKFGVGGVSFREGVRQGRYVDTIAFGAYKRDIFEKIGGYDEELVRNQDDEFNFRLIQNGGKIWLDPSIKSTYYPRNSISKLFRQYFQYGFYKVRVMQKRKGFASWRHIVPGIFIFTLLLSFIFYLATLTLWPFYLILGFYLTVNILATLYESINQIMGRELRKTFHDSNSSFLLLPVVFFTLHFAYGFGFICGIFYFWNKWNDRKVKDYHFDHEQFLKNSATINQKMSFKAE